MENFSIKKSEYHYCKINHTWKKKDEDDGHKHESLSIDDVTDSNLVQKYHDVSYFQLYKFANVREKIAVIAGIFSAAIAGSMTAIIYNAYGLALGSIIDYSYVKSITTDSNKLIKNDEKFSSNMTYFLIVSSLTGVIILIFTYSSTYLFNSSAMTQCARIRQMYLSRLLDKDMSWHDVNDTCDFASRNAEDMQKIQEGLGEVAANCVMNESLAVACIIQGLVIGWDMMLVTSIPCLINLGLAFFIAKISAKYSVKESIAVAKAAQIADETLSSIKTVIAFDGQEEECNRYEEKLHVSMRCSVNRLIVMGIGNGISQMIKFCCYALGLWYGIRLVIKDRSQPGTGYTPERMIAVYGSVLTAMEYIVSMSPFLEACGMARGSASKIFSIIEATQTTEKKDEKIEHPKQIFGNVRFEDVVFSYPARRQVDVLNGFNLTIKSGETVALVGTSGCGKSTCISLLERLYDLTEGKIFIDDINLKNFDVDFLRKQIGLVDQEPVLFENTIEDNIRFGFLEATMTQIENAARIAQAHDFIIQLPQGYQTLVGEGGAQLSGGQKQRIAIARAVVRDPAILLLDEATASLDTESEALVQKSLDEVSKNRTTIIIAHRISTIRKADRIIVISDGQVAEEGSYEQLMSFDGLFKTKLSKTEKTLELVEDMNSSEVFSTDFTKVTDSLLPQNDKKKFATKFDQKDKVDVWSFVKLNLFDGWTILLGIIFSCFVGASFPLQSLFFGKALNVLTQQKDALQNADAYSLYFVGFGIMVGICIFFHTYLLGAAGERFVIRLKSLMFQAYLKQEIGWFDRQENGVGSLGVRLSSEPSAVQGALGQRVGMIFYLVSSVTIAFVMGIVFQWKITLASLSIFPIMTVALYFEERFLIKENRSYRTAQESVSNIAVEAIANTRLITTLGISPLVQQHFEKHLSKYHVVARKSLHVRGIVYGIARSSFCFCFLITFSYGAKLLKEGEAECDAVLVLSELFTMVGWVIAAALAFSPNYKKGLAALTRVTDLLNRTPEVSDHCHTNNQLLKGNVEYKDVCFSYPIRPQVQVLDNFNLLVPKGTTIALVGSSGCGKSTVVQLLGRFYDPTSGDISIGSSRISDVKLSALRKRLGFVFQEPKLFSRTIAENIAYGDINRDVSYEEVINAARKANIHSFVVSLPLGYDTRLGERGTQLSGGQKQRIAIARALIRNPEVLLLDEATSALDSESEEIVQEALNNARIGRTCIVIAHRLKTIVDSDVILVLKQGKIVEVGKHAVLMKQQGIYWKMHEAQKILEDFME